MTATREIVTDQREKFAFHDDIVYLRETKRGLTRETVEEISRYKDEPEWMLKFRLRAFDHFQKRPMPNWTDGLDRIDFDKIVYYRKPSEREEKSWDDVPEQIKATFERLGIPEAERKFLAGVGAQYDSEVVYHSVREELSKIGVVFMGTDQALKEYPDIFKQHFGTVVPPEDNKFAALNSAVWSGGSFVYVPKGVEVPLPLQAYFRINGENTGQFERTLIVVDEGAKVHYIEGCLPEAELVSLGDEMVAIDSVEPGTLVMNSDGFLAPVDATRRRSYHGDMLKVVPLSVGNAFELTPEHPVLTLRRRTIARPRMNRPPTQWDIVGTRVATTEPEWVAAGELEAGDLISFPIAVRTQDHPEISDDQLRFLGYYLAEGSAFRNGVSNAPTVTISLHTDERDKIDDVRALMSRLSGKPAGLYEIPSKHEARIHVYSAPLMEFAKRMCGTHSAAKQLHPDLMELPVERQRLLLDTYLAGDGSRHSRDNGRTLVRAGTVSRTLAYQLQEILARLGIFAGINIRKAFPETMADGRVINHREQYIVHYEEGRTVNRVIHDRIRNCFWVPIRKIESRPYDGWVYNLEMASAPNAYLAKGFAVHNCTAPIYATDSLHAAVVEVVALPGAKVRYTTIQNWSNDVYNLVTKRAHAYENSTVEWIDANTGSRKTVKFPAIYLRGEGARAEVISVAVAGRGQHQDTGAKAIHLAPNTTSRIVSKSVSKDGGRATYRGQLKVAPGATNVVASVRCDALMLDDVSRSDTYPYIDIQEDDTTMTHEATVGKISADQVFYLMSRGLTENEATNLIVQGFLEVFTKELPMEYAIEFNRLVKLEMEGSLG
ncbi:MAG TPA: Fe-S cluster assembly protein SufB [Candidatus Limnocylindrales bacterium]|nr:Fe-S cluster assembly protein SufB [Candidatus Limnocylindrales bacterium]